jgi:transposase-like protein
MRRKVSRPDLETLLNDIEELGYLGTGRKYGVSDSAIRKWIKTYQEETLK